MSSTKICLQFELKIKFSVTFEICQLFNFGCGLDGKQMLGCITENAMIRAQLIS